MLSTEQDGPLTLQERNRLSKQKQRSDPSKRTKIASDRKLRKTKEWESTCKRRSTKEGWAKNILGGIKYRAKKKGLEFSITWEDVVVPDICPVLGIPLILAPSGKSNPRNYPNAPSVDRLDNSKGYTKENIRVISYRANALKSDSTLEELEKICSYMRGDVS